MDFETAAVNQMECSIEDVWLFGSQARGDGIASSDIDVLVVSEDVPKVDQVAAHVRRNAVLGPLSVSHYTRAGFAALIRSGALFAWHIRLEGLPLFSRRGWLARELKGISPYRAYAEDLRLLHVMVDEVWKSLDADHHTVHLEASILAIALRNAAMMLSFVTGRPDFSANAILNLRFHNLVAPIFCRIGPEIIADLLSARLASERGILCQRQWTQSELLVLSREIRSWLEELSNYKLNAEAHYATPVSASA